MILKCLNMLHSHDPADSNNIRAYLNALEIRSLLPIFFFNNVVNLA